jgi:Thiamine pyrophosphate enzyme, N-terminal TPP binding domain
MAPDEIDGPHALVRVLEEAGVQFVFGMPGGDTGRIFEALHDSRDIQTILVRHEQVGSIMAEMYGRLTGKPGVVMGQGIFLACNALFGSLEAVKGASPMLLLGDFTDMAPFMHHAPYQAGTGEHEPRPPGTSSRQRPSTRRRSPSPSKPSRRSSWQSSTPRPARPGRWPSSSGAARSAAP